MYIVYSILHFFHSLNTSVKDISLGMFASILTMQIGSGIGGEEITGNNVWDMIIKIGIPIITGVIIPIVNKWLVNRSKRKNR